MGSSGRQDPAAGGDAATPETRWPVLPCFVAWLFPGAGHLLIGQRLSGLVFAGVVLTTFCTGLALGGTVYARDPEQPLTNLALVANLGTGPLDVWARARTFGTLRYQIPDSLVDSATRDKVLSRQRKKIEKQSHTYGRTFLLTAGLMNLLLILDVYDRCVGRKPMRSPPVDGMAAAGGGP